MDIQSLFIPIAHAAEEASQSTSPVAVLGLNWQLFIAQLINFGVILFILWKWVFTPVANMLTKRTEKIEKSLSDAQKIAKDKEEFEKWKAESLVNARHEASVIITLAQTEAGKVKDGLVAETKQEQQKLVEQAKKQIEQEKNLQLQNAKEELADLVTNATEKILRSKLDEKKDKELIKEMLKAI